MHPTVNNIKYKIKSARDKWYVSGERYYPLTNEFTPSHTISNGRVDFRS